MFSALNPVTKYIILGLLAALVATGLGWATHVFVLKAVIASKEATIAEQNTDIIKLKSSLELTVETNKKLENTVKDQNAQIDAWLYAADTKRKDAEAAIAKAKADGEMWKKKYHKLLDQPPANPADQCQSLDLRLTEYIDLRSEK